MKKDKKSVLVWPDVINSIVRSFIPFVLPEFHDTLVHPGFQVRDGDEFIRDIAIKGIPSSGICCCVSSNADVARDPDKSKFPPILKQIWMQFMNFRQNGVAILHILYNFKRRNRIRQDQKWLFPWVIDMSKSLKNGKEFCNEYWTVTWKAAGVRFFVCLFVCFASRLLQQLPHILILSRQQRSCEM